jgi:hypothetical protein
MAIARLTDVVSEKCFICLLGLLNKLSATSSPQKKSEMLEMTISDDIIRARSFRVKDCIIAAFI